MDQDFDEEDLHVQEGHEGMDDDEEFDDEKYEYVDENGNPIDPELVRYMQQQQKMLEKGELEGKSQSSAASSVHEKNEKDASKVPVQAPKEHEEEEGHEEYEEEFEDGEEGEEEEVYYDQYNQKIPDEEVRKYKEMAARGEIDMEGYDDGEEQFENEEEYIDYYVQAKMSELKAQGKKGNENEIRQ